MAATFEESLQANMTARREELRAALHSGMKYNQAQTFLQNYQIWKDLCDALDNDTMTDRVFESFKAREEKARLRLEHSAMDLLIESLVEQAKEVLP